VQELILKIQSTGFSITQFLNVNPKQAVGGTAALMALASSKMPKKNYNSLINSVPGLSSIAGGASPLSSI